MKKLKPKIVVVGSFMMDLVVKAKHRPQKGETLIGDEFGMFIGGKGANQAIAAARSGARVHMIGRLGHDFFGDLFIKALKKEKINTDFIVRDFKVGTGIGAPVIDANGDNSIIIIPRANMRLTVKDIEQASRVISRADVLLLQLEVPIEASKRAAQIAKRNKVLVILDPAPAKKLPNSFFKYIDVITPNEIEANDALLKKGVKSVVITLGKRGAFLLTSQKKKIIPAYKVKVIDTTGAGDAFCGALAVSLARGQNLEEAIKYANAAGAFAVTIMGASPSMPTHRQITRILQKQR